MDKKTKKEIENLETDSEVFSYFKEQLGIDEDNDILAFGRLVKREKKDINGNKLYIIKDIRLFESNQTFHYPISDNKTISHPSELNCFCGS